MSARTGGLVVTLAILALGACDRGTRSDIVRETTAVVERAGETVGDGLITMTIQSRYFVSAELKSHEIDVDTDQGVVTLEGKVHSEDARQQAVRIASAVDGVTRVEDRLGIASDAAEIEAPSDGESSPSPRWITTKIQAQYYIHPGLKPWNIDVSTSRAGVVTLTGEVDSDADRAEAVKIASSTEGVTRVEDWLHRREDAGAGAAASVERSAGRVDRAVDDAWITAKIQSRYFLDGEVKGRQIDVDTNQGIVTLRGSVHSHEERLRALAIARQTNGVREVRDQLQMKAGNDGVGGFARREASKATDKAGWAAEQAGRGARRVGQRIEDAWITTKIQATYFVTPDIKTGRIDVETRNGVVTLNGAVGTQAALDTATNVARETAGVKEVVSHLKVDPSSD